jgi:hypothetical protein
MTHDSSHGNTVCSASKRRDGESPCFIGLCLGHHRLSLPKEHRLSREGVSGIVDDLSDQASSGR